MKIGPNHPMKEQPDRYWSDWIIDNVPIYFRLWMGLMMDDKDLPEQLHCPCCGVELTLDNDNTAKTSDNHSNWWVCPAGCMGGTMFIEHQAWQGFKSKPGDSWSLSWVK